MARTTAGTNVFSKEEDKKRRITLWPPRAAFFDQLMQRFSTLLAHEARGVRTGKA
jgi:hypothetical protein